MASTFLHFPSSSSLSHRTISFAEQLQLQLLPTRDWFNHQLPNPRRRRCAIYACSIMKSRGSRKIKSNVELCYEIRDFVKAVGLPEGHVPSMKELSQHGRTDLAHVVRRRGYKRLRELLTNSTNTEETEITLDAEKCLTAQDDKVNDAFKGVSPPIEGSIIPEASSIVNYPSSSNARVDLRIERRMEKMDPSSKLFTNDLEAKDDTVSDMLNDVSSSGILPSEKNSSCSSDLDSSVNLGSLGDQPIDPSPNFLLDEEASYFVNGPLENFDNRDSSLSIERSARDENSSLNAEPATILDDPNYSPIESSINISLEDKVANFIQNGYLGTIDDNFGLLLSESDAAENIGYEYARESDFLMGADYTETEINGNILTSSQSSTTVNPSSRVDPEELTGQFDKNLNIKTSSKEKQVEISHLKFMLHQKELELSHLKEQIKKEKHALSLLQTKAETEIGKAQQLISEKDSELLAVEESLSGLEECVSCFNMENSMTIILDSCCHKKHHTYSSPVQIQYCGEGEIVEVAGSFNGWQHRIKMDRQPSSNIMYPIGSSKFRLWSAVLWLYPGVYEIKFIVDGNWRIDPQRETTGNGAFINNILQVGV